MQILQNFDLLQKLFKLWNLSLKYPQVNKIAPQNT